MLLIYGCAETASPGELTDIAPDTIVPDTVPIPDTSPPPTPASVTLAHIATTEMVKGTHRPELVITPDGGLMVGVVHPQGNAKEVGSVKHMAYHLDAEANVVGDGFALTTTTSDYGEPADHRMLVVGDELVVVYQTLIFKDDMPAMGGSGPAEQYTKNQSLMLARFTLDGTETFRDPIVAHASDFDQDNFPDHCMAYDGENLIVSTGSMSKTIRFRVVSLTGEVSETITLATGKDTIGADIGNSLFWKDDQLIIASGQQGGPMDAKPVMFASVSDTFDLQPLATHSPAGVDTIFPTGTLVHDGITYIGYSVHAAGGSPDIMVNPYHPRLAAFGADWEALDDVTVSEEPGAGHVHPTVVAIGDTLYFAWSRSEENTGPGPSQPQVLIERYSIQSE